MKELSESEVLSLLYSERERLRNNNLAPGWSNWAIIGAVCAISLNLLSFFTDEFIVKWNAVLLIIIGMLSGGLLLGITYQAIFSNGKIYFKSRFTTLGDVANLSDSYIYAITFLAIFVLLICIGTWGNSKFLVISFALLFLNHFLNVLFVSPRKEKSVPAEAKYAVGNYISNNIYIQIILVLFVLLIAITASWSYVYHFQNYIFEFKIASYISAIYLLIFTFIHFNTCSKIVYKIDEIIEEYIYGNLPPQMAFIKLSVCQYGLTIGQIVEPELRNFFSSLKELEDVNQKLDEAKKTFEETKPNAESCCAHHKNMMAILSQMQSINQKTATVVSKIEELSSRNSQVKFTEEYKLLEAAIIDGYKKMNEAINKYKETGVVITNRGNDLFCQRENCLCDGAEQCEMKSTIKTEQQ